MIHNVLSLDDLDTVWDMYKELNNLVYMPDGICMHRHSPSTVGRFLITYFNNEEFKQILNKVIPVLEQHLQTNVEPVSNRVLRYINHGFIEKHLDSNHHNDIESNLSVLIQMSDRDLYKGGDLIIDNKLILMSPGDLVYYTYDLEHEVKKIKQGERFMINIRCYYKH